MPVSRTVGDVFPRLVRTKIVVMCAMVAFLTALVIGSMNYQRTAAITEEMAVNELAGKTRLMAQRLKEAFTQMQNDAFVVSRTPPIDGLYRSLRNFGIDKKGASTTTLWRNRLERIFISVMSSRPSYVQFRYVGVMDGGRELVRVNRTEGGFERVPFDELQRKGGESYYPRSLRLNPGETYFSEVTYNREHGRISSTEPPVIRVVVPVFFDGLLFGVVIVNADYGKLVKDALASIRDDKHIFVLNHAGDYVERLADGTVRDLEFHQNYTRPPPGFVSEVLASGREETVFRSEDRIGYFVHTSFGQQSSEAFLGVAAQVPRAEIMGPVWTVRYETLYLTAFLLFMAVLLATGAARRMTEPLESMIRNIRGFRERREELDLPVDRDDEFGEFARAFQKAAADLIDSELKTNRIADSVLDSLVMTDRRGTIKRVNPVALAMFGYGRESDMLGRTILDIVPQGPALVRKLRSEDESDDDGAPAIRTINETVGRRCDGSTFPMEAVITELELDGDTYFIGLHRDITERMELAAEREFLISSLSRSNAELENFAHIASHDLKEPLRAISNHSSFLLEDYEDRLGADGVKRLHRLQALTARMEKLISDLLYFSRLGQNDLSIRETDFNEVIADIRDTLEDTLEDRNARIEVPQSLPVVVCDSVRVTELFRNLITNAIKYNDSEPKRVEIGVREGDPQVFYVRDNGIGIDEKFREDAFRLFKRLHSQKLYGEGTGAGLTFVKKIVEQHGGKIWIEPAEGGGTVFCFTLRGRDAREEKRAA